MNLKAESGVTLIELLTAITIVALLMGIGVPSYRAVTNSNRVAAEINGLLGDLQLARGEAIKQGLPVSVCPSTDSATCAGTSTWGGGWIVIVDPAGDLTGTVVLRIQKAIVNGDTLTNSTGATGVTFNREGFSTGFPASTTFTLHDSQANQTRTRCLTMNLVGMMTSSMYDGNACQ